MNHAWHSQLSQAAVTKDLRQMQTWVLKLAGGFQLLSFHHSWKIQYPLEKKIIPLPTCSRIGTLRLLLKAHFPQKFAFASPPCSPSTGPTGLGENIHPCHALGAKTLILQMSHPRPGSLAVYAAGTLQMTS